MAPEMSTFEGYGFAVDYWAVGIMLYEMLAGTRPNTEKLFFPAQHVNPSTPEFREFIQLLLEKRPERRPGFKGGPQEILTHEWFQDIDQEQIKSRQVPDMARKTFVPEAFDWWRLPL